MNYSISFAQKSDELALKRLFLNCFDDTLGFVNMFFEHHFVPEDTVCVYLDERIIGQAHFLSCAVGDKPCFYIYAVCVDAEYRGQGIGRAMLEFIKRECLRRDSGALLHPQDEDVFSFYRKCGFTPCGFWKISPVAPCGESAELLPVTAAEYSTLRKRDFPNESTLLWDDDAVAYALSQETFFGYTAYKTETDYIVLCGAENGEVYVKETTAPETEWPRIAAAVNGKLGGEETLFLQKGGEDDRLCGFGFNVRTDIYMNLLLD